MESPHDYRIRFDNRELNLFRDCNVRSILEVCSGDGRNLRFLKREGFDVTGIESPDFMKYPVIPHPIFGEPLPFPDGSFDCVYSYQYLNHNFKDRIVDLFREIYRVLKKGGLFSVKISDMAQLNFKRVEDDICEEQDPEFPAIRFRKLAPQTFAKLEGDEKGIPHYAFYKDELIECLENIGFRLVDVRIIRWNIVGNFSKPA